MISHDEGLEKRRIEIKNPNMKRNYWTKIGEERDRRLSYEEIQEHK